MTENERKILFVEDDEDLRHIFFHKLRDVFGNVIKTAQSGNEGIELLTKSDYDIIISDYEMSDGSGLDLLRFKIQQNISTPFIFFTHALEPKVPFPSTEYLLIEKNEFQALCSEILDKTSLKKII